MWTMDNTEGFTQDQLAMINKAVEMVAAKADGVDAKNINDAINNARGAGRRRPKNSPPTRSRHFGTNPTARPSEMRRRTEGVEDQGRPTQWPAPTRSAAMPIGQFDHLRPIVRMTQR